MPRSGLADLTAALEWAKGTDRTPVPSIATDAHAWTPGDADRDVGVPEMSRHRSIRDARKHQDKIRARRRIGV